MEWNMPLCFVILLLCYNVHILGASYAYITVNPTEIQLGVNLTMSCKYNGSFTVSSIVWEKNSAGKQIRLFTNCIAAYTPDSTVYNKNRTTYSCDQVNNIYNLTLNNLVEEDDGNSWSCSLRLSVGNSTDLVVYTIRLPYSTTTRTSSSPILIPLLVPLLLCVTIVLTVFMVLFCCGCLDCCIFCRVFDNHKDSKRCHLTWYCTKSGCCSFFFCTSSRKRGICLCGHDEGERCGGCLSCRRKCICGWPGNCQSKELSCCGCCFCLCCVQEDEKDTEASIDLNNKKSGPPAFHLGTKHKVETETTRNFNPDEHRPLPPISGEIENKQSHRPQPQPPEYRNINDQNRRGLSANYDDGMQDLPNDMPTSSRLPSHLAPLQPALQEDIAFKEPKKKRKKRKKKEQLNEGKPDKEITNPESN